MFVFVLVLMLALLAILGPLAGSDSRDGLDWTPGHFWLRRPSRSHRPAAAPAGRHRQGNAPESALKSAPTGAPIDDARRALSADAPSGARTSCQGACVA